MITQLAEYMPDKIQAVAYLTACLPVNGQSMMDLASGFDPRYIRPTSYGRPLATLLIFVKKELVSSSTSFVRPRFVERGLSRLKIEPVAPVQTRLITTPENFGRVSRYNIECLQDRAIPLSLQRQMHGPILCERVYLLDSNQMPMSSVPATLAQLLNSTAEDN